MPAPGAAVQRIPVTAWVTVVPPSVTGGSSGAVLVATTQPGVGSTLTESSGFSVGSCTRSEIVEAVGLSLGTRKVISPNPPAVVPVELTVTRAEAEPIPSARTAAVTASSARIAREGRAITEGFSCARSWAGSPPTRGSRLGGGSRRAMHINAQRGPLRNRNGRHCQVPHRNTCRSAPRPVVPAQGVLSVREAGEGEPEVAVRIGPPVGHPQSCRGQLGLDPLAAELGRDLGTQVLPGGEGHLQLESPDRHHLLDARPQAHLDPFVLGVPERDVVERVEVEVGLELSVEHGQHVAVERGGDPGGVVVGADQAAGFLDQIGTEQEGIARSQGARHSGEEVAPGTWFQVADGRAEEGDQAATARRRQLAQVPGEVTDDRGDLQAGVLVGERRPCRPEHRGVDVERNEPPQGPRCAQGGQQQPRLLRRAAAEFDEQVGTRGGGDLRGPRVEDRPLGPGRVVLRQPRDPIEQFAAALVVEPAWREGLRRRGEPGPCVRPERGRGVLGTEVVGQLDGHAQASSGVSETPSGVTSTRCRSGTSTQAGSSSHGSLATAVPSGAGGWDTVRPQGGASSRPPSVSRRLSRAAGSSATTSRTVAPTASGPRAKTRAARTALSTVDSASRAGGSTARSTRPVCDSSHRPSVNGAAALSSSGMPTVAERTAARTHPDSITGATEAKEASAQSGRAARQRAGSDRPET